jgi:hypothetical protein
LMNEVIDADQKLVDVDPLRHIEPKPEKYPTHIRVGPDWFAACSNWLAAWERTGDTKYRDKILVGAKCMANMPHQFFSGDSYGYDPATNKIFPIHDNTAIPHLAALMGGPELCMEMGPLLQSKDLDAAWLNYCRYYQAPAEEQRTAIGGVVREGRGSSFARMTAFAAKAMKDKKLADRAWQEFNRTFPGAPERPRWESRKIDSADVPEKIDEIPFVSTNDTAQRSLNAIELLELVGDAIPERPTTTTTNP